MMTLTYNVAVYTSDTPNLDVPIQLLRVESHDRTPTLPEVAESVLSSTIVRAAANEYAYLLIIINDAFTDEPAVRLHIEGNLVTRVVPPVTSALALSSILNPKGTAAASEAEARERKQREDFVKLLETKYSGPAIREQISRVHRLSTAAAEAILTAAENRDPAQLSQALKRFSGWTKEAEVVRQAALDYQDWEAAIVYARRLRESVGGGKMKPVNKDDLWYDAKTTMKWWFHRVARVLTRRSADSD